MREAYDDMLNPWLTGAKSGDEAPNSDLEARYGEDLVRLVSLFERAQANYRVALESRRALDFDDLEAGARRLLDDENIRRRWRASILRILVDEYQDTNPRQQAILDALTGDGQGALFVVGDARQSIYRFRGADVTVFRRLMLRRARMGGRTFELSTTFRTHTDLLAGMDEILGHVMGDEDSERLYEVPYTRLDADRLASEISPPYLEVVAGVGTSAEEARERSGQALTRRLLELRATGEIQSWAQVALLFRASSGFDEYERSLETAGIPFVTVAGRGFYDRPEIRDVLNSLAVLADPTDDLAVAGFLRSPAIGMSDLGIFHLRGLPGQHGPMWPRLQQGSPLWSPEDLEAAEKARLVLGTLLPQVDRLPAAELIKRLVDALNLRAALAASNSRLWRNVDKLIDDAQASQVVRLSEFLAYLRTLRTVGAREGEAPAEAGGSVRLMTIHKAKGLEFDVAVLADASRRPYTAGASVYFSPTVGLAFRPDRLDGVPLAFRLAAWGDGLQAQAESRRLLYVALTRAREKLIICGHISQPRGSWMADGWFGQVLEALGLSADDLAAASGLGLARSSPAGQSLSVSVADETPQLTALAADRPKWPSSKQVDLFRPLQVAPIEHTDTQLDEPDEWLDRATGEAVKARGLAVGRMVHLAIERGWGTSAEGFRERMLAEARRAGLALESQRQAAVDETQLLLDRLHAHPFWGSIQAGNPRLSEVPFTTPATAGVSRSGKIDLLLRTADGWTVVDFKTEHVTGDDQLAEVAQAYFEFSTSAVRRCRPGAGGGAPSRLSVLPGCRRASAPYGPALRLTTYTGRMGHCRAPASLLEWQPNRSRGRGFDAVDDQETEWAVFGAADELGSLRVFLRSALSGYAHADAHGDGYAHRHSHAHQYAYVHANCDGDFHPDPDPDAKHHPDTLDHAHADF